MPEISLIAVDLDGTLLTSKGELAPEGARLIGKASQAQLVVILATARNPATVRRICDQLTIADPIICTNGAQIWASPSGPVWSTKTIPRTAALSIARFADDRGWELSITVDAVTYWRQRPGQALGPIPPDVVVVPSNVDAIAGDPVRIFAHQAQAFGPLHAFCQAKFGDHCYPEIFIKPDGRIHSLGIFPRGADKGSALALVLERLGVGREKVMAIGDNLSDLPMFDQARIAVAMGNAADLVKARATAIAPSNDDEGVAWAIQTFVPL